MRKQQKRIKLLNITSTTNSIVTSNADRQFVDVRSDFVNTNFSSAITTPISSALMPIMTNSNSHNNFKNLDIINNQLLDLINILNDIVKNLQNGIND